MDLKLCARIIPYCKTVLKEIKENLIYIIFMAGILLIKSMEYHVGAEEMAQQSASHTAKDQDPSLGPSTCGPPFI